MKRFSSEVVFVAVLTLSAYPQVFSPPVNVTQTHSETIATVTVDLQDNIYVFSRVNGGPNSIYVRRSTDGGQTFSPPLNIAPASTSAYGPQVAFNSSGRMYLAWGDGSTGNDEVLVSSSSDGGQTFTPSVNISNTPYLSRPIQAIVDEQLGVYVLWVEEAPVGRGTFLSRSIDNGATFLPPVRINSSSDRPTQVLLTPDGEIKAACIVQNSVAVTRSFDAGATFLQPVMIPAANGSGPLQARLLKDGSIVLAWAEAVDLPYSERHRVMYSRSTDGGTSFSNPSDITSGSYLWPHWPDAVALDLNGGVDVLSDDIVGPPIWNAQRNPFFSRAVWSEDHTTFYNPVNIANTNAFSGYLQLTTDVQNNIYATWIDFADFHERVWKSLISRSTNGGATFSTPISLQAGTGPVNPVTVVIDHACNINLAWDQHYPPEVDPSLTFSRDIFFSRAVGDTTAPKLTVMLSPSALWPANHKLVQVSANIQVSDVCDPNPVVRLVSIAGRQPLSGGDVQGATFDTDDRSFSLRANKDHVYTITYEATDHAGNSTLSSATASVPHDQGKN